MKRLLLGTNNPSKFRWTAAFFDPQEVTCVSPAQLGLRVDPPEQARTAEGNVIEKALAFHRASGLPVLTEDSGLVFLDLPRDHADQPGVRVRRPIGHAPLNDDEDMLRWYLQLVHRHGGRLRAAWQDAWCLLTDEDHYVTRVDDDEALARHAVVMLDTPGERRTPGWPLDSMTFSDAAGKYLADMTPEEQRAARQQDTPELAEDSRRFRAWLREQTALLPDTI
ncbi:MAG: non-canonical purine NTP pyrophosphatase [Aristaeellaceae bacterium]